LDHPLDPDAKITKMKDGRTHLAHKAEHAVDLETGARSPSPCRMRMRATPPRASTRSSTPPNLETVVPDGTIEDVVADKGYHSHQVMIARSGWRAELHL
jgi:transposase